MQPKATTDVSNQTYSPRPDLTDSLHHSNIDPTRLSAFQRIILTTDGTLTDILEAYLSEKIHLIKLSEGMITLLEDHKPLALEMGQETIERKVLLQGRISRKNWIYAESLLVPERLDARLRERLIVSQEPMGRLWLEHRLETFKEIIHMARESVGDLADHFQLSREDILLSRTYRVFSNRQPIIVITEKFPERFFLNTV